MEENSSKIFYLKKKVVFPYCTINVVVAHSEQSDSIKKGDRIMAFPIRRLLDAFFYKQKIATLTEVIEKNNFDNKINVQLKGLSRVRIKNIHKQQTADYAVIDENGEYKNEKLVEDLRKKSQELIFLINVDESDKLIDLLNYISDINQLTDFISNYFVLDFRGRYKLLNELNLIKKGNLLIKIMDKLILRIRKKNKDVL
jgi:ATP-dependent Lon protease